jgi:hypothetical protein
MGVENEIIEIENYIKTLELNDETNKEINKMIEDGMSKGLIFDFIRTHYRGTMFSSKVIKKEEYDEFQKYINRCEEEQSQAHNKFVEDIINSGAEYSKDELKYNKLL